MRILITGGGGLIGQAIAKKHIAEGDEVFIYDTQVNKYNDYDSNVGEKLPTGSYSIGDAIFDIKPDIISHQAALVGVGQSQYNIKSYVHNNIGFTAELIQELIAEEFKGKILHAGSMGPYGELMSKSANESHKIDPQSIYAVTKQTQEELLRVFSQVYSVPVTSLRYFSVYGTEQSPLNPYTGVLSVIANQILNNDKVEMYEDGYQTRDLVHIEDVANAHFLASRLDYDSFLAMNVGTGKSYTLKEIAEKMLLLMNSNKELVFNGKYRKGDIRHMKANISKITEVLNWKPEHDLLKDIETYCNYVLENKKEFTVGNTIGKEQKLIEEKGLVNARP